MLLGALFSYVHVSSQSISTGKLASDIKLHICWCILYFNFNVKTGHESTSKMFLSESADVTTCFSSDLENLYHVFN
jgi:hypothetical protein